MPSQSSSVATANSGPLSGIRVLDLSRVLAAPWAAQILGDLGADVIKVEQTTTGDDTRAWGPPFLQDGDEATFAPYFLACNRNKRSIAIDLAKPEGAEIVRKLAAQSDVLIENFKVGGLAKYGLDYVSIKKAAPNIIYCSVTGFGQTGPYAPRGGYDFLIQAMGGIMSVTGPAADTPGAEPTKVGLPAVDLFTGMYAAIAIQAALRHKDQTGEGQHIDCALLDSAVAMLANQSATWLMGGPVPQPMGNAHPSIVPYRTFPVSDGHIVVAVGNTKQFIALCDILGRPDIGADPRYQSSPGRKEHRDELEAELTQEFAKWTKDSIIAAMSQNDVPGGPINTVDQVFADQQVVARKMLEPTPSTAGTELPLVRFPAILSASPATIRRAPPQLGEHSVEVLSQVLKLPADEIAALCKRGVIGADK
ncbi:CaiB/BaiF CoA transferase family protein [Thalassovita taeanensis]|uniref:Crotonobetainyl-CoA:carnitine CoA-transferase CaiB n=1 Tax=Thalassovita taeanensis TaxID=657014 RepID=A0A1H9H9L0_9RHOB|nr:CaiB/BaiF CoA-transferase family protein [Thalassovita taeanensis]SEQ59025.1 Crotonobetainyl-CoA:carnitine CoA-transferase CaiB [Thalassovita taeanensis]